MWLYIYNSNMKERGLLSVFIIIVLVLTTACGSQVTPGVVPEMPSSPANPGTQDVNEPKQETLLSVDTAEPNCRGDEVNPIAEAIADEYDNSSYRQVMTWFCNGAEFEDILVALETENQTDTTANEMLQMLAEGFSWREIWQLIGLID